MELCNFSFVLYLNFQYKKEMKRGVMASDASHALEVALEQMDGIIAGASDESSSTLEQLLSHLTFLFGTGQSPLGDLFYFFVYTISCFKSIDL